MLRLVSLGSLAGLVGLTALSVFPARGTPLQQSEPLRPPGMELSQGEKRGARLETSYPDLEGSLEYSMLDRKVRITWMYGLGRPKQFSRQEINLHYWPTEVTSLEPDVFAVAGYNAKGKTLIQRFEFDTGNPLDPTGGIQLPHLPPTKVFRRQDAGKEQVRVLFGNHGDGGASLFVQFHDSGDVYRILVDGSEAMELIASPDASVGVMTDPRLSDPVYDRSVLDDAYGRSVYLVGIGANSDLVPEYLVFQDTEPDGAVDTGSLRVIDANATTLFPTEPVRAW